MERKGEGRTAEEKRGEGGEIRRMHKELRKQGSTQGRIRSERGMRRREDTERRGKEERIAGERRGGESYGGRGGETRGEEE